MYITSTLIEDESGARAEADTRDIGRSKLNVERASLLARPSDRTSKADNPVFNFKNDALSPSRLSARGGLVRPSVRWLEGGKKTDGK